MNTYKLFFSPTQTGATVAKMVQEKLYTHFQKRQEPQWFLGNSMEKPYI